MGLAPVRVAFETSPICSRSNWRHVMTTRRTRLVLLLALGSAVFTASTASGAPPAPCEILPAETWSRIMGYTATATPGDMNCTYQGPAKTGGGQIRIMAIVGSS